MADIQTLTTALIFCGVSHFALLEGKSAQKGSLAKGVEYMKSMMLATLAFFLLTTLAALAQEPAKQDSSNATAMQEKQEHKTISHTKSVTGCLQKGDEPGEFSIKGEDGKTWGLRSSTVKLEQHVGHQVTVTGSTHRESKSKEKAEEKKEGQMENAAGKEEYGDLRVTNLKMVSDTCSK